MRIESGRTWADFHDSEWRLMKGKGERTYDKHIDFKESFSGKPAVVLGITWVDFMNDSDHRIQVKTKDITPNGFSVEIRTWDDTHLVGAGVNWLAYGE